MADATADLRAMLDAVTNAFAAGDNARAELLLSHALDQGAPWDEVTTAAARGVSRHRDDLGARPELTGVPAAL